MAADACGLIAELAVNLSIARNSISSERPDVVLLDLSIPEGIQHTFELLSELGFATPPIPALVLTSTDTFADRVEVARLGGRGFLHRSLPPSQVIDAVEQVLNQPQASKSRVLAVDDDAQVLAVLKTYLEPHGLAVTTLEDPMQFWQTLEEVSTGWEFSSTYQKPKYSIILA